MRQPPQPSRIEDIAVLLIPCPYCGPRAEIEFRYGGEAHLERPTPDCDEQSWAAYLHSRHNVRGRHAERWRHTHGCGQFFNAIRDTLTDHIEATYEAGEASPLQGSTS